jgi:hypothetical protein
LLFQAFFLLLTSHLIADVIFAVAGTLFSPHCS